MVNILFVLYICIWNPKVYNKYINCSNILIVNNNDDIYNDIMYTRSISGTPYIIDE